MARPTHCSLESADGVCSAVVTRYGGRILASVSTLRERGAPLHGKGPATADWDEAVAWAEAQVAAYERGEGASDGADR